MTLPPEKGYSKESVTVIFNRDMMMNESELVDNCAKSVGLLSHETIVGQHPWVSDVEKEMSRIKQEKEDSDYFNLFNDPVTLEEEDEE